MARSLRSRWLIVGDTTLERKCRFLAGCVILTTAAALVVATIGFVEGRVVGLMSAGPAPMPASDLTRQFHEMRAVLIAGALAESLSLLISSFFLIRYVIDRAGPLDRRAT